MHLYDSILKKEEKISVIGLGYVGIVLAIALAKHTKVIGFDTNATKISHYLQGIDPTLEVGSQALQDTTMQFTSNPHFLKDAKFHIVAVPTPIYDDHVPNLTPLIQASETLGKHLQKGSIVVYESTVYPGVTEEICVPLLEKHSNLVCGKDFFVGYSPERVNPGDRIHTVDQITKIVSGMDEKTLDTIAKVYELIIEAGVYRASSIRVAEAAKVIENAQRDINIAFVNELAMLFDTLGLDTKEVLDAAGTKWNFLPFTPGLVGGHCIGVDPYYLTYKALLAQFDCKIILSGRAINDGMGKFVAEKTIRQLIDCGKTVKGSHVAVLGITFKENCPDIRNSKVTDVIHHLQAHGINVFVCDPLADSEEVKATYNLNLVSLENLHHLDGIVVAVAHDAYQSLTPAQLRPLYKSSNPLLLDIKSCLDKALFVADGFIYWRL